MCYASRDKLRKIAIKSMAAAAIHQPLQWLSVVQENRDKAGAPHRIFLEHATTSATACMFTSVCLSMYILVYAGT